MGVSPAARACFPVSVVMERRPGQLGPWSYARWIAAGVVAGEAVAKGEARRRLHREEEGTEQILWAGMQLVLHRDAAESYWYNLVGSRPALFVVCRADPEGELSPCVVTADYDEAGAYMEADDAVFAVPLPPEVRRWLEEFVMSHYRPAPPVKRQRQRWTEDGAGEGRERAMD